MESLLSWLAAVTSSASSAERWSDPQDWIWSEQPAHPALVDDDTFAQVQARLAAPGVSLDTRKPRRTSRTYVYRGLLFCGLCERRMQGSWNNGKAHYRCVFAREYAQANNVDHPRSVYLREDLIVEPLDDWLSHVFDPAHLADTIRAMAQAQLADDHRMAAVEAARLAVAECERKLASYRALVDAGSDPAVVAGWIAETETRRQIEKSRLDKATSGMPRRLTEQEITTMVTTLGGLRRLLHSADPADKAAVYEQLGLRLTYEPGLKTVIARTEPGRSCSKVCPRGDTLDTYIPFTASTRLVLPGREG